MQDSIIASHEQEVKIGVIDGNQIVFDYTDIIELLAIGISEKMLSRGGIQFKSANIKL